MSESGKSRSWSLFKKSKRGSTSFSSDNGEHSIGDDASTSSRGSLLKFSSKKKNKSKRKSGSSKNSFNGLDDYSAAESALSPKPAKSSLQQHLAKNNRYVDTTSGDEGSLISGLSGAGGTPSGSAYGSSDWAAVYGSGGGGVQNKASSTKSSKNKNKNRIAEEVDGYDDDDDDDIMAIPASEESTPPVHHTPGMSAEDKFMAYFQKKQPASSSTPSSATTLASSLSPSEGAQPASLSSLLSGASTISSTSKPAPTSTGDHAQMAQLDRQRQAELNANRLREKQRQRQLKVLEQRRLAEAEEGKIVDAQPAPEPTPPLQELSPASAPASASPPATAANSDAPIGHDEITEIFLSPAEARKARARKAVEERKAKARAAVEARKAKAKAAMNGGVDPEPASTSGDGSDDAKEPLKTAATGASSSVSLDGSHGSHGSRSRKSGKSIRSSRSGKSKGSKSSRGSRSSKNKRRNRSSASCDSSVCSADTVLSEEQQEQIQQADDEMHAAEIQAAAEQRQLDQQETERKRTIEAENTLKEELDMERVEKARVLAARQDYEMKEAEAAMTAAKARAESEAQKQRELEDKESMLEAERARAEMLELQGQLSAVSVKALDDEPGDAQHGILDPPEVIKDCSEDTEQFFEKSETSEAAPVSDVDHQPEPRTMSSSEADDLDDGLNSLLGGLSDAPLGESSSVHDSAGQKDTPADNIDDDFDDDLSALLDDSDGGFDEAVSVGSPNKMSPIKNPPKKTKIRVSPIKSTTLSPIVKATAKSSAVSKPTSTKAPKTSSFATSAGPPKQITPTQPKNVPSTVSLGAQKKLFSSGDSAREKAPPQARKTFVPTPVSSKSSVDSGSTRSRPYAIRTQAIRSTPRRRPKRYPGSPSRSVASASSSEIGLLPRSPHRPVSDDESEGPTCSNPFIAKLHRTRGHCQVCVFRLSPDERVVFEKNGRHLRVNVAYGGCEGCHVFPKEDEDDEAVRLCCKCFFDTHKIGRHSKHQPFSSGLVLAGASPKSHR